MSALPGQPADDDDTFGREPFDVGTFEVGTFEVGAVELVLQQGSEAQRAAARQRLADEPMLAIEVAEARMLVEEFRSLRIESSLRLDRKLAQLCLRAERSAATTRRAADRGRNWLGVALAAAAAVLAFVGLRAWDPLGCGQRADASRADAGRDEVAFDARQRAIAEPGVVVPVHLETREELLFADSVEVMRRQLDGQASPMLREAFEAGLREDDRLDRWMLARNSLALLRRDHDLRADAMVRQQELQRRGGAPDTDLRAQECADRTAAGLIAAFDGVAAEANLDEVAIGLRALVAAGPGDVVRHTALLRGGDWLAQRLPEWSGARLVGALSALVEVAAVTDGHREALAAHGRRLVDEVLVRDQQNWDRGLPELVGSHVAASVLGEAGRLLARLPGFDVEARRAGLVRQLTLGQLRSRRVANNERPEVVSALVYGFADLLAESERDDLEHQLLRWLPVRLVPDFVTAQQQAWGLLPGRLGFTRLQAARRRLAMVPSPQDLSGWAGLCLCLCTDYAAFPTASAEAALGD